MKAWSLGDERSVIPHPCRTPSSWSAGSRFTNPLRLLGFCTMPVSGQDQGQGASYILCRPARVSAEDPRPCHQCLDPRPGLRHAISSSTRSRAIPPAPRAPPHGRRCCCEAGSSDRPAQRSATPAAVCAEPPCGSEAIALGQTPFVAGPAAPDLQLNPTTTPRLLWPQPRRLPRSSELFLQPATAQRRPRQNCILRRCTG